MKPTLGMDPRKGAFVLVLCLTLMAFMLGIILALSSVLAVESELSEKSLGRLRAKQNAILGIYVALGNLQRAAGPDQRVTARADIFDSNPDTIAIEGVENPQCLGVFKSIEIGKENQSREDLRTWSKNMDVADRIDWLVSFKSDGNVHFNPLTTKFTGASKIEQKDFISVASYEDDEGKIRDVNVGLLDLPNHNNVVDGRFGWWVTDENCKFIVNKTKPKKVLDQKPFAKRWAIMAPQKTEFSIIPELSSIETNETLKIERMFSKNSLGLMNVSAVNWVQLNHDDFTTHSQSIPVDVTQGCLKQDLSVYLATEKSPIEDSDYIIRGNAKDLSYKGQLRLPEFMLNQTDANMPQFGILKSWYESGMKMTGFDQGVLEAPRRHEVGSHGLHPVVMRAAVYIGVSFEVLPGGNIRPVYLIYPKFVLWNPHNIPIAPAKYVIQVRAFTTINTQINANLPNSSPSNYAAINVTPGRESFGYVNENGWKFAHLNLANSNSWSSLERDPFDGYPYFNFVINNKGFAPGETLYFTAADKHPNADYVDEKIDSISPDFSNSNLLVNEDEGAFGFFYYPAQSTIKPKGNQSTGINDTLQTTIYFRDTVTGAPAGKKEPSLSTKLYHYKSQGDLELLVELDLEDAILENTTIDWEHINSRGKSKFISDPLTKTVEYRSLSYYKSNPHQAIAHRGHGFFIAPMGNLKGGNRPRLFARHNLAVGKIRRKEPLVATAINNVGRIYNDAIPGSGWFNNSFPSQIPKDNAYSGITIDGYDSLGGFGLVENSKNWTQGTVYPLYDYIRSETGLLSLGFLKNVNFSQYYWQPSFPFGNSEAHTHVDRNNIKAKHGGDLYTDLSYLLNESLFDRFFLSTIPQVGEFTISKNLVLPNSHHRFVDNFYDAKLDDQELRASKKAFDQVAANIVIDGGFNVNSTSLAAWKALLAATKGETVIAANSEMSNPELNAPLSAKIYPLLGGATTINPKKPEVWSAIRSLDSSEIDALASAIVKEVKRRGPFLSLSDFVNRRLIPNASNLETDYLGLKGALQAAIDKISTEEKAIKEQKLLNSAFYEFPLNGLPVGSPDGMPKNKRFPEHETGMPEGIPGSRMFGVPGFLTQGDILSVIAPVITVRGDTFLIRSYGSAENGLVENSVSNILIEAIVQRISNPVNKNDSIVRPEKEFGRSFKIISMRTIHSSGAI